MKNLFLFVIWEKARAWEPSIRDALVRQFRLLDETECRWPRFGFTRKLAEFYGWKGWFCWWNKARKCGRGPFKVYLVEDEKPTWAHDRDTSGRDLLMDKHVDDAKHVFRALTHHGNRIHSSVTQAETENQFRVLFGVSPAAWLARGVPLRQLAEEKGILP